jgi:hypothetical protein
MWCRYAIANLDVIACKYLCDIGIHVITQMTKNYVKQVESWKLKSTVLWKGNIQ